MSAAHAFVRNVGNRRVNISKLIHFNIRNVSDDDEDI